MKGLLVFAALIALVGWASWRLYPREQHQPVYQVDDPLLRPETERPTG